MKPLKVVFKVLCCLPVLASCSKSDSVADRIGVPRRPAYPRLLLPDSAYVSPAGLPLGMEINREATFNMEQHDESGDWVTVSYDIADAEIYYTFTPVTEATVAGVIDNRLERLSLNLGGNSAELTEFITPEGLAVRIIEGGSATTPVQFLATDNSSLVVSGSAFVPALDSATRDSLAPVVGILRRDIIKSLVSLHND